MGRFYLKAATAEVAVNGFLKTGTFPVNRNILNEHEFNVADLEKLEPHLFSILAQCKLGLFSGTSASSE
jgi:hypothetical protein